MLAIVYTFDWKQDNSTSLETLQYHKQIIEGCREGKRSAQYALYNQYAVAMYNTCLRMVNSVEDAEDILQQSFFDVFRKLDQYRYESTPGAWIKKIVVNNCLDFLRKRHLVFEDITDQKHIVDHDESLDQEAEIDYTVSKVKAALQLLPEGYRVVATMYLLEGFDHAEISEVLGISESTSKSQYHRAKKQLISIIKASN